MRRIYSPNAPFKTFWEQTHICAFDEYETNWVKAAAQIDSKEDLIKHLRRARIPHLSVLSRLYSESESILVLGAGDGLNEINFLEKYPEKEIILSDISTAFLSKMAEFYPIKALKIDSRDIDQPSSHFDFVYAMAAETFFDDAEFLQMLKEMTRILKPGGQMLISSAAVDIPILLSQRLSSRLNRALTSFLPPVPWVLANRWLLNRKIKLVGYARTTNDFFRLFSKIPDLKLRSLNLEYKEERDHELHSIAFVFSKEGSPE